ncbi:hypothetical protein [Shewanella frigidimarina]|uniref:hypothetical protein n=1 Tax=Shewanella frigidimarina TaxID=56812 RepID=UPI003D7B28FB
MSNIAYLSGWSPELCILLRTTCNYKADFNRLRFKHVPSTKQLQQGEQFETENRDHFIFQFKSRVNERLAEGVSKSSIYTYFKVFVQYIRWCDIHDETALTQSSLEGYMSYLNVQVMQGLIKSTTYKITHSQMKILFTRYLDLPHHYFERVTIRGGHDQEPFESYTRSDLNQLLPFLRQVFKQTHTQFMAQPEVHINAPKSIPTMTFVWQGKEYPLCSGITKMMCAATYLLAYYTYSNTSDLFRLKQPENASTTMGDVWYTMPTFKRRAFKTIQVEMGGHELNIPKYSLDFFDKLLEASKRINTDEDATLLQTLAHRKVQPMNAAALQSFLKHWMEKHLIFTDQTGQRLRPVISRFRETGAQVTAYHQGAMANDIMLNNTPNTRRKHYSEGNKIANQGMLQDTVAIREEQIKNGGSTLQARENLALDVLVIDQENMVNHPNLSRTSNGGSCENPFSKQSKKYTKKAQTRGLAKEGERLACADLLSCFGCPEQVIVQSVTDIWCLLSFKSCIEESLYLHLDASHYRKNFEKIIEFITQKILPNLQPKLLKQAEIKLNDDGPHPAWDEAESIHSLIPIIYQEVK